MNLKGGIASILDIFSQSHFNIQKNPSRKPLIFALTIFLVLGTFLSVFCFMSPLPKAHAVGNTYYIDATGGLDTNNGLSEGQAWKTINKVNVSSFSAGDSILLKRGEIWREQLTFPSSGAVGSPITIGDFGSGTKPTIYGSDKLNGSWTNVSGNIYKISLTTEAKTVLNSTTNLTLAEDGYGTLALNHWDWYSNFLYVNIGGDPTGGNIEAGRRSYGIFMASKNYVTIGNIIIRNTNSAGIYLNGISSNITVNSVEGYSNANEAFKQVETSSATYTDIIGNYNLDDGFSLHDSATATINGGTFNNNVSGINNIYNSQITLNNITASNNSKYGLWVLYAAGGVGGSTTLTNSIFSNNLFNIRVANDQAINATNVTISGGNYGLYLSSTGQQTFSDIQISEISLNSAVYLIGTTTATISKANFHDNNIGHIIDVNSGSTLNLNNSLIYKNLGTAKYAVLARTGSTSTIKNSVFYDNTHGLFVDGTGVIGLYSSVIANVGNGILFNGGAVGANVTLSNNDFYNNSTNFSGGSPTNTNGLALNPTFTNASSSDFTLLSNSPLIDAGYDTNITTDYAGEQRYDVSGVTNTGGGTLSYYDIGAYEYIIPSVPVISSLDCPTQTKFCYDTTPDISISDPTSTTSYYYLVDQTLSPSIDAVKAGTLDADGSFTVPEGQIHPHATFYVHVIAKNPDGDFSTNYGTYKIISRDPSGSGEPSATITEPSTLITSDGTIPTTEDIITEIVSTFESYKTTSPEATFITDLNNDTSSANFDASGSISNKGIVKYEWDFGDGQKSNSVKTDHKYTSPGRYTVTLVVTDSAGNKNTTTKTVDIKPIAPTITNITTKGTALWIEGKADPNTVIYFTIHSNPFEGQGLANNDGYWTYYLDNASEILGEGDHAIFALAAVKLSDNTELKGVESKTYDFKMSVDNGKLKVETQKTKIWQIVSGVAGLTIVVLLVFLFLRKKRPTK